MAGKPIEAVLQEETPRLMALPGVVGTGLGEQAGEPCIIVFVGKMTPQLREQIPNEVEGHVLMIEETGEFRAS